MCSLCSEWMCERGLSFWVYSRKVVVWPPVSLGDTSCVEDVFPFFVVVPLRLDACFHLLECRIHLAVAKGMSLRDLLK